MRQTGGPDVPAARDAPLSPTLKRLPAARHNQARARISRRPLELNGLGRCGRGGVWGTKPLAPALIGPTRRLLLGAVLVGWLVGVWDSVSPHLCKRCVRPHRGKRRTHVCKHMHVQTHTYVHMWSCLAGTGDGARAALSLPGVHPNWIPPHTPARRPRWQHRGAMWLPSWQGHPSQRGGGCWGPPSRLQPPPPAPVHARATFAPGAGSWRLRQRPVH